MRPAMNYLKVFTFKAVLLKGIVSEKVKNERVSLKDYYKLICENDNSNEKEKTAS